jgi:prophage tail gpP-like protein
MPKQEEFAEVVINGGIFRDWDSVKVIVPSGGVSEGAYTRCELSVTEKLDGGQTFSALQIKPGDRATVILAGKLVCSGFVTQRQAAYDAQNHTVLIIVESQVSDLVDATIGLKESEFRDYPLKQIVDKIIKPFGIQSQVTGQSSNFDKKFKETNLHPGESVIDAIERLARMRQMQVHDDENGNLVLANGPQGQGGDLVEGKNILSANCLIENRSAFSKVGVLGQQRGDDQTDDEKARKPAGSADTSTTTGVQRHRPLTIWAEHQGDSDDMAKRAQYEAAMRLATMIQARIMVQGWLQSSGDLWKIRSLVTVNSPMLPLYNYQLAVFTIIFAQDNASGTTTTLELIMPSAMGNIGQGGGGGAGGLASSVPQGQADT